MTECNPLHFQNGVTSYPTGGYQSGTGICGCCAEKYYEHPVSPFWGGAKKNKKNNKKGGAGCGLTSPQGVATEGMQVGEVLYGGKRNKKANKKGGASCGMPAMEMPPVGGAKRGRGRPRKQKGGENSLIPVAPSTPADLANQGPFTDQHANWMQRGTGSGVPETKATLPQGSFSTALETSGGARKKKTTKKTTKKQRGGQDIDSAINMGLAALAGGERKRGRPKKNQNGGGSDWVMTANSRGPINYPTQSEQMFRTFNQSADMISNADLYWAPLKSPMFNTNEPVGYNMYNPY